jgi:hypothetical protein
MVLLQTGLSIIDAFAVEAHSVDDGILQWQPEHPWFVISWLWLGR